jgi:hypothetical protein
MNDETGQTLSHLKDWSTWLVAIDTGALALIGTLAKWQTPCARTLAATSSVALLVSIISASILVGAIPVFVERLSLPEGKRDTRWVRVSGKRVYQFIYGPLRVQVWAVLQHVSFLAAIALVTLSFAVEMKLSVVDGRPNKVLQPTQAAEPTAGRTRFVFPRGAWHQHGTVSMWREASTHTNLGAGQGASQISFKAREGKAG